jgi:hypothetical protein
VTGRRRVFGKPIVGRDTNEFLSKVRAAYGDATADHLRHIIDRNDTLELAADIINAEGRDFERAFRLLDDRDGGD